MQASGHHYFLLIVIIAKQVRNQSHITSHVERVAVDVFLDNCERNRYLRRGGLKDREPSMEKGTYN